MRLQRAISSPYSHTAIWAPYIELLKKLQKAMGYLELYRAPLGSISRHKPASGPINRSY